MINTIMSLWVINRMIKFKAKLEAWKDILESRHSYIHKLKKEKKNLDILT
jgi:hypothetical protein